MPDLKWRMVRRGHYQARSGPQVVGSVDRSNGRYDWNTGEVKGNSWNKGEAMKAVERHVEPAQPVTPKLTRGVQPVGVTGMWQLVAEGAITVLVNPTPENEALRADAALVLREMAKVADGA